MDYKKLGNRIRERRKELRFTQEQLAENIEMSVAFVGHIERGTRKLSVDTLCKLCDALNMRTDEVLGR